MRIEKIVVNNYRLLKNFSLSLEDNLSLIIGKNNCGKTSLLLALEKFLSETLSPQIFSLDDFNIEVQQQLVNIILSKELPQNKDCIGIELKVYISYGEHDDITNISSLIVDVESDTDIVVLQYEYKIDSQGIINLRKDYESFLKRIIKGENGQDNTLPINKEATNEVVEEAANELVAEAANEIVAEAANEIVAEAANEIVAEGANEIVAEGANEIVAEGANEIVTENAPKVATMNVVEELTKIKDWKDEEVLVKRFLKKYHTKHFLITKKSLNPDDESKTKDLLKLKIPTSNIINFKKVSAKREVSNDDNGFRKSGKTLSKMSSVYYEKILKDDSDAEGLLELQNSLKISDEKFTKVYSKVFKDVISKVERFGGIKKNESNIKIISNLEEKNILKDNTLVMYNHSNHSLPEDYNGLGYMNLIAMIFDIEIQINEFKKKRKKEDKPADLNLLFIEEPEAHTHPQMQYVFIKNIKNMLESSRAGEDEDKIQFNLQTIITTHSSHVTSASDFDDVKYFYKKDVNQVISKNLKDLKNDFNATPKDFQFLKKYLTLNRAELFFADKAILVEGDTERILVPAMLKKIDEEFKTHDLENEVLPLLSQNISIIEVGAHSHIFDKFIQFLGIKTLIITDMDYCKKEKRLKNGLPVLNATGGEIFDNVGCSPEEGEDTNNHSLKYFYNNASLVQLKGMTFNQKVLINNGTWINDFVTGSLSVVFQVEDEEYSGNSFEDAFMAINGAFLVDNAENFRGLKNRGDLSNPDLGPYEKARLCIADNKKTTFALDIVYVSEENATGMFSNWKIPLYIKEGLLWLKK